MNGNNLFTSVVFEDIFLDFYIKTFNLNAEYETFNYFALWLINFSKINKFMYYNSQLFKRIINSLHDKKFTLNYINKTEDYKIKEIYYNDEMGNPYKKLRIPNNTNLSWQIYIKKYFCYLYKYDRIFISIFDGDVDKFGSISNKKLSSKYLGNTDYNDKLKNINMKKPIMKGLDSLGRPFLAIKYKCLDEDNMNTYSRNHDEDSISRSTMVIFQRHLYSPLLVVGSYYYNILNFSGGIKPNAYLWLYKIINGYKVPNPRLVSNDLPRALYYNSLEVGEYNWIIDN